MKRIKVDNNKLALELRYVQFYLAFGFIIQQLNLISLLKTPKPKPDFFIFH
jgi:hypothetical protein